MGGIKRLWHRFTESVPDTLACLSYVFFSAWLVTTFAIGGYLALCLMKALIPKIGIPNYILVLSAVTASLAILFLIDLEKLSETYRRWSRDTWSIFVKIAVVGFAFAILSSWIALFKQGKIPLKYLGILVVACLVFSWRMDRKAKSRKRKDFSDVDDLLKKKD